MSGSVTPSGTTLTFSNFGTVVTDTGTVNSFLASAPSIPAGISLTAGAEITWEGIGVASYYAGSDQVINLTYQVVEDNAGEAITSVYQNFGLDNMNGSGVSFVAVETVKNSIGNLLATNTWSEIDTTGTANVLGSNGTTSFAGQQTVDVDIQITMSIAATATASAPPVEIAASYFDEYYDQSASTSTASIGDMVFLDSGTGLESSFNSGPGVAGVTVELMNAAGTSVLATTTTNSGGEYLFNDLAAGTYEVKFISPSNYHFGTQGVGGSADAGIDSSANATTGMTGQIVLTAGQADMNVEAGLLAGAGAGSTGTIGSVVFLDLNGDGLDDSNDSGVSGVTVELLNSTGTSVLATTVTSSGGGYEFTGLSAGSYEVKFLAPSGDVFTTQNATLANGATINSVVNSSGVSGVITLTTGQSDLNVNAGLETQTASIGETVWLDTNKDGLLDSGESGVAGVTVELLNGAGTSVLATTTTNASGNYLFSNLLAGTYEVKVLAPTGDGFTTEGVALSKGATVNSEVSKSGVTAPITLTGGENYNSANAGLTGGGASISVIKLPNSLVVNQDGTVTYTFDVTNNGSEALTNVCIKDNIGTADDPVYVTPTLVTTGTNGTLGVGQTWVYSETLNVSGTYCGNSDYNGGDSYGCGGSSQGWGGGNSYDNSGWNNYCGGGDGNNWGGYNGCGGYGGCGGGYGGGGYDYSNYGCNSWGGYSNGGVSEYEVSCGSNAYGECEDQSGQYNYYTDSNYSYNNGSANCYQGSGCGDSDYFYGCGGGGGCGGYGGCGGWGGGGCGGGGYQYGDNAAGMADTVTVTASAASTSTNQCTTNPTGGHLTGGCTAWLSTTFKPTNCSNGATYNFTGVKCTIKGSGVTTTEHVACPNATVTFSSSCTTATTVFNATTNTWVTTLPANCNPGNVFITGLPLSISSGYNLANADVTFSIGSSTNNCGVSNLNWDGTCTGYNSFSQNSTSGLINYNQIGVEACDNLGSSTYCAGAPVTQYSSSNCGNTNVCTTQDQETNTCGSSSSSSTVTVTATDTKEVQVLGCNSDISVDGTAPTGNLTSLYGSAQTLEFTYTPGNTVSLEQVQAGMAAVTGTNSNSTAFIEISNNANPFASGAQIYFEGMVQSGENIYADATTDALTNTPIVDGQFSTTSGADIYAYVFSSESAFLKGSTPVQTMTYNTSGSQAMHLGDTIGSLDLVGFVGTNGGHLV